MEKREPEWHQEAVHPKVLQTLRDLQQSSVLTPFYLAGGTGLALHLGHRRSLDLDFFTSETFHEDALVQKVQKGAGFSLVSKEPGTLHAHIAGTKVSFLAFPYPLLFSCEAFLNVKVADPRDIACMKVSAIAGRGTKRDFIDLYAVSQEYGLPQILEWFARKFAAANYSKVHLLKSLMYFANAEKDAPLDMLTPITWEEAKGFFTKEVPPLL